MTIGEVSLHRRAGTIESIAHLRSDCSSKVQCLALSAIYNKSPGHVSIDQFSETQKPTSTHTSNRQTPTPTSTAWQ
jgi:hypothetical protein